MRVTESYTLNKANTLNSKMGVQTHKIENKTKKSSQNASQEQKKKSEIEVEPKPKAFSQ